MSLKIGKEVVLVIPDLQAPAHHPDAFKFLKAVKDAYNPTKVVNIGDSLDFRNFSTHAKDPNLHGATEEVELGLKALKEMYKIFPEGIECTSNHNVRPFLRANDIGLTKHFLKSYEEFMGMPSGWKMQERFLIDDILYIHGEGLSGDGAKLKATQLMQRSVVFGHLHSYAGISWFASHENLTFGFNVGCLIDPSSPYFNYGKHMLHRPILGCGVVYKGMPIFVPMVLNKSGRWIGKLHTQGV